MHPITKTIAFALAVLLLTSFSAFALDAPPHPLPSHISRDESSQIALLRWKPDLNAVAYEVEIFRGKPADLPNDSLSATHIYTNQAIYTNGVMIDLSILLDSGTARDNLWWRVRALNLDREAISLFSPLSKLERSDIAPLRDAPLPRARFDFANGTVLLYPVYSFIPTETPQFEVEVSDAEPENADTTDPSPYRVFSRTLSNANLYDPDPRIGTYWWRVRGVDSEGTPLTLWSEAIPFRTEPDEDWQVGVMGDSISHGGGRLSYGPADWSYSYEYYLDFPVINLSFSGDTSENAVARFDRDVAPFPIKYLLIMNGTNSLRAGVPPEDVIADLKTLQEKCRALGIAPILLTLPPINPANIQKAFDEPTYEDWQASFAAVNAWIRTQPHIDIAAAFKEWDVMPTELAVDGIHGDWKAKRLMADIINRDIHRVAPDVVFRQMKREEET